MHTHVWFIVYQSHLNKAVNILVVHCNKCIGSHNVFLSVKYTFHFVFFNTNFGLILFFIIFIPCHCIMDFPGGLMAKKNSKNESCSVMSDSATPWIVTCQAPLSMEFSRQEYWSGLPFPSPGDLPDPGVNPGLPHCMYIAGFWSEPPGKPSVAKNLPVMQETRVWSLGQEDPLEKRKAIHPNIFAWETLWTEEPGGGQSLGLPRVRCDLATKQHFSIYERLSKFFL